MGDASVEEYNLDRDAPLGFLLVFCSGLATAIGASAVYFKCLVNLASNRVLASGIGIASGVMLYVSFVEIIFKAQGAFADDGHSDADSFALATATFFAGVVFMKIMKYAVHKIDGTHSHCVCDHEKHMGEQAFQDVLSPNGVPDAEVAPPQPQTSQSQNNDEMKKDANVNKLRTMGFNTALAIAIHNFPEGLATFVAALADPKVGVTLAIGIGIHNVPEGLCVAWPFYWSHGNRHLAFLYGLLSGLSEPFGALLAYILLKSSGDELSQVIYGVLFGMVGGMMVAIVVTELLPTAFRYDETDTVVSNSVFAGMFVMAVSLVVFEY